MKKFCDGGRKMEKTEKSKEMKIRKIWNTKELKRLQELCKNCNSFSDLEKKSVKAFPKKSWSAVQSQANQHKDWIKHFEKKNAVCLTKKERKLPEFLKKGAKTLKEISAFLDVPKEEIFPIRDKFAELGYDIQIKNSQVTLVSEPQIDQQGEKKKQPKITSNIIKILFVSDICFGLKTQQPTLLYTAYKIAEEAGVFFAVITGNIVAGKPKKGKEDEYFLLGAEEQLDYAKNHIPKASFKTTFINGSKELSWEAGEDGFNIGKELAAARPDLSCVADLKTTLSLGKKEKIKIGVMSDSGFSAYTKSYPLQGTAENLQEAERYVYEHSDPLQMIFIGGLHTALLDPRRFPLKKTRINDFDKIAIPSLHRLTASQTVSRRRGASHVLGFVIASFEINDDGYLKSIPFCDFYNLTAYFKDNDYLDPNSGLIDKSLDEEEKKLLNILTDKPHRKGSLSRRLGISVEHVDEIIGKLNSKGIQVHFNKASKSAYWIKPLKEKFEPIDTNQLFAKRAKIVSLSDTHFGHKHERPDLLEEGYKIGETEQVDAVTHSGDVFEGEDSYKGQRRELICHGADAQLNHGLEVWPKSKIPTFMIMGSSHEKVFLDKCGYDIVGALARLAHAEKGMNLTALQNADGISGTRGIVDIKGIQICLDHPSGGIPYGRSYRPQKLIENLVAEMDLSGEAKTILCGHLHVALFMLYKGVAGFLVPCLQDKTGYIEAKGYTPWLGVWIIEVNMDQFDNITKITPKYYPFEPKKSRQIYQVANSAGKAESEPAKPEEKAKVELQKNNKKE